MVMLQSEQIIFFSCNPTNVHVDVLQHINKLINLHVILLILCLFFVLERLKRGDDSPVLLKACGALCYSNKNAAR